MTAKVQPRLAAPGHSLFGEDARNSGPVPGPRRGKRAVVRSAAPQNQRPSGTFAVQHIEELVARGAIASIVGIAEEQYQPSSLDLTLSEEGFLMRGSVLPALSTLGKRESVEELVYKFRKAPVDLKAPTVLSKDSVYIIRLRERLKLPSGVGAYANNKSSIGRIDLQSRLLCDGNPLYDKVPLGYEGDIWVEVIPKSFDVRVREGDKLNQAIFFQDRSLLGAEALIAAHHATPLLYLPDGTTGPLEHDQTWSMDSVHGLWMSLDLEQDVAGWVAKKCLDPIDLNRVGQLDPRDYFDPVRPSGEGYVVLRQGAFYIFSTYEYVSVPPDYAVEMLPYDTSAGEFRAHYAGFFDPGFGFGAAGEVKGTPAVLEVRPYEDDLIVRHRQPVCKMAYERLSQRPAKLYGVGVTSNYAAQRGPRLSKYFRQA